MLGRLPPTTVFGKVLTLLEGPGLLQERLLGMQLTGEAVRVCGGRGMLKRYPLERYYRDSRASAVMRPWTQDIATQQAWETALGTGG